jgi:hypothetical protein
MRRIVRGVLYMAEQSNKTLPPILFSKTTPVNQMQLRVLGMLRLAGNDRGWKEQGEVIAAQVGDFCKCCYHAKAVPKDDNLWIIEASRHLGDILVQVYIASAQMGLNVDDILMDAIIALRDQMDICIKRNQGKTSLEKV